MNVFDSPLTCYEPEAHLSQDHEGKPIVFVDLYVDDPKWNSKVPCAIQIHLTPIEAKYLGLALMRIGQNGVEAEITREQREIAKSWMQPTSIETYNQSK